VAIGLFLASVGFMPAGPRLAATEAASRVCFFFRRKRQKRRKGWGKSHEQSFNP
jgi:hypothetical protein